MPRSAARRVAALELVQLCQGGGGRPSTIGYAALSNKRNGATMGFSRNGRGFPSCTRGSEKSTAEGVVKFK